jgi:CRP-like cAMP-binding protein
MQLISLAAGEAIFQEGDPSDAVYVIDHGEIAIRAGEGEAQIEIVRLHAGDLFGEAGVLEKRPRSAAAVATQPTDVLATDADSFLKAFGVDNDKALSLLKLLCHRLRDTTRRAALAEAELHAADLPTEAAEPSAPRSRLRLIPDSERLHHLLGDAAIDIFKLPFLVGNRYGGETSPISSARSFCVPARADTELAAPHFEILRRDGRLCVRDLSGHAGTIVNGKTLSSKGQEAVAALRSGENSVIAGHRDSPFRFRLVFDPPAQPPAA